MKRCGRIALLIVLLLAGCQGGPSYYIEGDAERGASLIVPATAFVPGFTVQGVKKLIRIPSGELAGVVGKGEVVQLFRGAAAPESPPAPKAPTP